MTRRMQAVWVGLSSVVGLGAGMVGGRLATSGMSSSKRANIVLGSAVVGAAAGAGVASYATAPKLQLTA